MYVNTYWREKNTAHNWICAALWEALSGAYTSIHTRYLTEDNIKYTMELAVGNGRYKLLTHQPRERYFHYRWFKHCANQLYLRKKDIFKRQCIFFFFFCQPTPNWSALNFSQGPIKFCLEPYAALKGRPPENIRKTTSFSKICSAKNEIVA